jgi:predicted nucleic-acid-binding protein
MIGLDTNILARYYVRHASDDATIHQSEIARELIESGQPLLVAKTVLLEFEWLLRGYYKYPKAAVQRVLDHLLTIPHLIIESRNQVETAVAWLRDGMDFADALHLVSYEGCPTMASFDDKKFARRAARLKTQTRVVVPT